MSAPRTLIISPVPTHPANAGNRARILHFSCMLEAMGLEVHFLFTGREPGDIPAMNAYWGDRFHCFCSLQVPDSCLKRWGNYIRSLTYSAEERKYNAAVDAWYDPALDSFIAGLQARYVFHAVIVEYVFLSRALLNFNSSVVKMVDTHDVFTNRYQLYLKNNQEPQWFSTYEKEEAKALNRADIVIAVQQNEKTFFEKISRSKIITVGHILTGTHLERSAFEKKLLFVGSYHSINKEGICFFIESVLGPLILKYPDIQLIIAGTICKVLDINNPNITLSGEFNDPKKIYAAADIVIDPVRFGTGLSIKTLEALSFGMPMVATSSSVRGLEDFSNKAFLVADTAESFVDAVSALIENESLRNDLVRQALNAVQSCNQKSMAHLVEIFQPVLSEAHQ